MSYQDIFLKNRNVGRIDKDKGVYISFRNDKHLFYKYNGWGLSNDILEYLEKEGIETVIVNFDNILAYITDVNRFYFHGIEYDFDGDKQLILPLKYWRIEK